MFVPSECRAQILVVYPQADVLTSSALAMRQGYALFTDFTCAVLVCSLCQVRNPRQLDTGCSRNVSCVPVTSGSILENTRNQ